MATYRELHGKAVKTVTTNPTDEAAEGQIWFNSTDNTFKSAVITEAWASGSPLLSINYGAGVRNTNCRTFGWRLYRNSNSNSFS